MNAQHCAMCPYFDAEAHKCENTEKRRKIKHIKTCPQRVIHKEVHKNEVERIA